MDSESESRSVVSDSLRRRGLYSPWNSPGQNTGVGSLSLLQGFKGGRSIQIHVNIGRWAVVWQTQTQAAEDRAVVLTLLLMCVALGKELYFCGPISSPTK